MGGSPSKTSAKYPPELQDSVNAIQLEPVSKTPDSQAIAAELTETLISSDIEIPLSIGGHGVVERTPDSFKPTEVIPVKEMVHEISTGKPRDPVNLTNEPTLKEESEDEDVTVFEDEANDQVPLEFHLRNAQDQASERFGRKVISGLPDLQLMSLERRSLDLKANTRAAVQTHSKLQSVPLPVLPMFDACCHLMDWFQESEGVEALLSAMRHCGVQNTALCGMPLSKKWDTHEPSQPKGPIYQTGRLYYHSATDFIVKEELRDKGTQAGRGSTLLPLMCGFNPTDLFAVKYVAKKWSKDREFWTGVGKIFFRASELSNQTDSEVSRANHPAMYKLYQFCSEKKLPVIFQSNAKSECTKKYQEGRFDYMREVREAAADFPEVKFLLMNCGLFERGLWDGAFVALSGLLDVSPNVYVSITAWLLSPFCKAARDGAKLRELVKRYPDRVVLATDVKGVFIEPPSVKRDLIEKALEQANNVHGSSLLQKPRRARVSHSYVLSDTSSDFSMPITVTDGNERIDGWGWYQLADYATQANFCKQFATQFSDDVMKNLLYDNAADFYDMPRLSYWDKIGSNA